MKEVVDGVTYYASDDMTLEDIYKTLSAKERHAVDLMVDCILMHQNYDYACGLLYCVEIINGISNPIARKAVDGILGIALEQKGTAIKIGFSFLDIYKEEL